MIISSAIPGILSKSQSIKMGWFGMVRVTEGHRQCHYSSWLFIHLSQTGWPLAREF